MIPLSETTDKLQIVLGGSVTTSQLQCIASYNNISTTAFTRARNIVNTNNTTDVDLVSSPSVDNRKEVEYISVYNTDTANALVTIKFDANGTEGILYKVTLAAGEKLEYNNNTGFVVIATTGAIKQSINQGANASTSGLTAVVLGGDVTNNNAVANTMQDVTGLSFSILAGKSYYFKFIIRYTAAAATTGSRWGVNASAGTAATLALISEYTLTATTTTRNAQIQAFDSPAASNASSIAANSIAIIEGHITATANATFIARFASEISASAIIAKSGSVCYYQQLN